MNEKSQRRISKKLSFVLRHQPESIGLVLQDGGWVSVSELIEALHGDGTPLTLETLMAVVADNDKQRFEFSDDRKLLRARQGHSMPVQLGYTPAIPPDQLFHGTATRFLESIRELGLIKGARHHVHLSTNRETMIAVGKRHGVPVVLTIDAKQMLQDGYEFFVTGNQVWLTEHVPATYLSD